MNDEKDIINMLKGAKKVSLGEDKKRSDEAIHDCPRDAHRLPRPRRARARNDRPDFFKAGM